MSSHGDDYGEFQALLQELEQHGHQAASAGTAEAAAVAGNPIQQICQFWPTLRTVLQIVLKLPFIPANVKQVIRQAINIFNSICSGGGQAATANAGGGTAQGSGG